MRQDGERRKFLRHPIQVPIKVKASHERESAQVRTGDLSEGGLRFSSDRRFSQGAAVDISIPILDNLFKLTGRVVYSSEEPAEPGVYKTGVVFDQPVMSFRLKLAEEILRIQQFQKEASRREGHEITEEEAASLWIKKFASQFAEIYSHSK